MEKPDPLKGCGAMAVILLIALLMLLSAALGMVLAELGDLFVGDLRG